MKILRYLILFLCLLSTSTVRAASPYVLESVWQITRNDYLVAYTQYAEHFLDQKLNLTLPDEIISNAPWWGAVITDGKDFYTIIYLPLKDKTFSPNRLDFAFKNKLRENSIIAHIFPDFTSFDIGTAGGYLLLVSSGLSIDKDVVLLLDSAKSELRNNLLFSFVQFYPERTLLPTLPPEQENESPFVLKVRNRSAKHYKEGKFIGKAASNVRGIQLHPNGLNFINEWTYADNALPDAEPESLPFSLGGFIDPDAKLSSSFQFSTSQISNYGFLVRSGTKILPPEEGNEMPLDFRMSVVLDTEKKMGSLINSIKEDWHVLPGSAEDIVTVCYPKQLADRSEVEGALSNAEMDKINERFAHNIRQEANKIGKFLSPQDFPQYSDFACTYDESTLFLASTNPFTEQMNRGNLADMTNKLRQLVYDHFDEITHRNPKKANSVLQEIQNKVGAEMQDETKSESGITFHKMDFFLEKTKYAVVYGFDAKNFYMAIKVQESSEKKVEQYESIIKELDAKIVTSKRLFAEKMESPKTILSSEIDGHQVRVWWESDARRLRYVAYVGEKSIPNVVALVKVMGMTSWLQSL